MNHYQVENVNPGAFEYEFMIIRDCLLSKVSPGLWYYGADNNLDRAKKIAEEIGNGFVVKSSEVEALSTNPWA